MERIEPTIRQLGHLRLVHSVPQSEAHKCRSTNEVLRPFFTPDFEIIEGRRQYLIQSSLDCPYLKGYPKDEHARHAKGEIERHFLRDPSRAFNPENADINRILEAYYNLHAQFETRYDVSKVLNEYERLVEVLNQICDIAENFWGNQYCVSASRLMELLREDVNVHINDLELMRLLLKEINEAEGYQRLLVLPCRFDLHDPFIVQLPARMIIDSLEIEGVEMKNVIEVCSLFNK